MIKPLWSDISYCMARMQGKQMLKLWDYDKAYGSILVMAAYRRAAWRAGDGIDTLDIVQYFLQYNQEKCGEDSMNGIAHLLTVAFRYGFRGVCPMVDYLAGGMA